MTDGNYEFWFENPELTRLRGELKQEEPSFGMTPLGTEEGVTDGIRMAVRLLEDMAKAARERGDPMSSQYTGRGREAFKENGRECLLAAAEAVRGLLDTEEEES